MKPDEIRNMTKDELISKERSLKEELMDLRYQAKIGKLSKPSRISQVIKDIARILTIIKEQSYARGEQKTT